jgi:hypothetical protein
MLTLEELEPRLALTAHGVLPTTRVVFRDRTVYITPPAAGEVVTVSDDDNGTLTIATSHKEKWQFSEDQIQQIVFTGHGRGQFTNQSGVLAYADGGAGKSVLLGQEGDILIDASAIGFLPPPADDDALAPMPPVVGPGGSVVAEDPRQFLSLIASEVSPQIYDAVAARLLPGG